MVVKVLVHASNSVATNVHVLPCPKDEAVIRGLSEGRSRERAAAADESEEAESELLLLLLLLLLKPGVEGRTHC